MKLKKILDDYVNEKGVREILQKMNLRLRGRKEDLTEIIMNRIYRTSTDDGLRTRLEYLSWVYSAMDESSIKKLLEDEGIPSSGSRNELFERLLYCISEEYDEEINESIFSNK